MNAALQAYCEKATEALQADVSARELKAYFLDCGSFYNDFPEFYNNATVDEVRADFENWRKMEQ